jgi:hypothetical protein
MSVVCRFKYLRSVGLGRQFGIGIGVLAIRWGNDDSGAYM